MVLSALGECRSMTRGLTAWASEAQETNTMLVGSSPHVRWICSGVPPAGGAGGASPTKSARGDAAAARPVAPAAVTNPRREIDTPADSGFSGSAAGSAARRLRLHDHSVQVSLSIRTRSGAHT